MNQYPQMPEQEVFHGQENKSKKDGGYQSVGAFLFDVLEMVAWSVFVMVLLFTFTLRLCRVEGSSMENTFHNGQLLLLRSVAYTPEQDDVVVFHMTAPEVGMEKTLVKRVIATGEQKLEIDFYNKTIKVDGVLYEDSHSVLKNYDDQIIGEYYLSSVPTSSPYYDAATCVYTVTVPENYLFVMGDNRNNSKDSRSPDVGFVDERSVLGKVVMSIYPFEFID